MPLAAVAEPAEADPVVQVELLPAWSHGLTGESLELGLHFTIPAGWHIYWSNPGDSGMPTEAAFSGPEGVSFSPLRYPGPDRYEDAGGLVNYVYSGETVLFFDAQIPADATGPLPLKAEVSWLVCKERCIAQTASIEAVVPIKKKPRGIKPTNHERLTKHRSRLPEPLVPGDEFTLAREAEGEGWVLQARLVAAMPATLYPSVELEAALTRHELSREEGDVVLRAWGRVVQDEAATAVLSVQRRGGPRWYSIELPVGPLPQTEEGSAP